MSYKKIIIQGNLGGNAEVNDANTRMTFSVAVSDNRNKNDRRDPEWFRVVVFGERLTKLAQYLTKGKPVIVEGSPNITKWTDQGGNQRNGFEIVLNDSNGEIRLLSLTPRGDEQNPSSSDNNAPSGNRSSSQNQQPRNPAPPANNGGWDEAGNSDLDDEIPF